MRLEDMGCSRDEEEGGEYCGKRERGTVCPHVVGIRDGCFGSVC